MKKIAVFGNAGGGKSILSRKLAQKTNLPLHILDKVQYKSGGVAISSEEFKQIHQEILDNEQWIIDGFGDIETLWQRLDAADTLVYIDLPIYLHFWWVTKRFLTSYFDPPKGWPDNSPLWKSSMNSYKALYLCEKYLTHRYRDYVAKVKAAKKVYHLRSPEQITHFLKSINP